jgi:TPP-dependent 2-oxoacid decarboxylase
MDMVTQEISSERLKIPLSRSHPLNDHDTEKFVIDLIAERVKEAEGDVVVIVDACVIRHDVRKEVLDLLKETGFPVYATPMGKTAINEDHERYGGVRKSIPAIYTMLFLNNSKDLHRHGHPPGHQKESRASEADYINWWTSK